MTRSIGQGQEPIRLGIDFGTTRSAVALVDRGNYPLVHFQAPDGDMKDWYPTLAAVRGLERCYGWDAWDKQTEPGWSVLRSFKRLLGQASPQTPIRFGEQEMPVGELLAGFLGRLRCDLLERSNLSCQPDTTFEVTVGVPAHSNSNQRFLTLDAYRRAGFRVRAMMSEPSAAGIEYAHRYRMRNAGGGREYIIIYDLGGGTFDASIVRMTERHHEVVTSEGIAHLGGDDFDEILAHLALGRAARYEFTDQETFLLLEECREKKESLHPNTRKITLDLSRAVAGGEEITLPVAEFYEHCQPLVEETCKALEAALGRIHPGQEEPDWRQVAAVYLVGGATDLPVVGRVLREWYGRRVRKSPYPRAATAIGLAIASDDAAGFAVQEGFTRHFGVWREADSGNRIVFDPIFRKDTPLPRPGEEPLTHRRTYHPVHNIGHLRYLECGRLRADGSPAGEIVPWEEIFFPYDASLASSPAMSAVEVRSEEALPGPLIEEVYRCDSDGIVTVEIVNHTMGYQRNYRLRE